MHMLQTVLLPLAICALSLTTLIQAQSNDTPDVNVQTTFPNNAFNRVSNGQANRVVFTLTQPKSGADSDRILTLESITGAFLNRDRQGKKGYVMRNMTSTKFKSLPLKPTNGQPLQVPFDFYPEFKPQEVGVEFRILVKDGQTSKVHNLHAYTGSVSVVEPAKSWFDVQLLSLYALLAAVVGTAVYWASKNYPGSNSINKRKQRASTAKANAASGSSVGTKGQKVEPVSASSSAYDEDWIPAHHLRKSAGGSNSPKPRASRTNSGRK
ncbi:uncharacterized protein FA14DRAFT_160634 [Meira miltonrushii]|uniref:Translocon-associated protein subunit alpha n=1 Tax=Meira miltonrushii TaxID=1280837 RepID=A0A316VHR9_9BASI|nr:uncharacterized protein FA14DRAFT_160634 [Meira miltonrushii]PWN35531.1 hypothetical protein FA14DRAFT_160634 [Meira miltonrushii]